MQLGYEGARAPIVRTSARTITSTMSLIQYRTFPD
jgi:hypothetical protein